MARFSNTAGRPTHSERSLRGGRASEEPKAGHNGWVSDANLYEIHEHPELPNPVLVFALEGWIDAGLAGAGAMAALLSGIDSQPIATFDTERLLDHRARRPVVTIVDGINTELAWPEIELRAGRDTQGNAVVALVGPEPDHLWRSFATAVAELSATLGVHLAVGLGAFPAPVPHTRPAQLASTATTAELTRILGFVDGTVNVPAGVGAAIERRFGELDIPAVSIWARVPHYVAGMPYPEASSRLLEGLTRVSGVTVDSFELQEAAGAARQRIDDLMAQSEEHMSMLRQLEAQADAEAAGAPDMDFANLPSGDELAAELERFLQGET